MERFSQRRCSFSNNLFDETVVNDVYRRCLWVIVKNNDIEIAYLTMIILSAIALSAVSKMYNKSDVTATIREYILKFSEADYYIFV